MKRAKTLIDGKQPKAWMDWMFDHTVIVAKDDPYLKHFEEIRKSTEYEINLKTVLGKNDLKLNFINKVSVNGPDYKIYYERAS